jgi:hypothetical protein
MYALDESDQSRQMHYEKWVKETPWPLPDIPLGVYLYADHGEVCAITSLATVAAIVKALPGGPWAVLVATAIVVSSRVIRAANEDSGGKGLRIRYNFALAVIDQVKRRGKGNSPCPLGLIQSDQDQPLEENAVRPMPYQKPSQALLDETLDLPEVNTLENLE